MVHHGDTLSGTVTQQAPSLAAATDCARLRVGSLSPVPVGTSDSDAQAQAHCTGRGRLRLAHWQLQVASEQGIMISLGPSPARVPV
jgi:hypothetical protein